MLNVTEIKRKLLIKYPYFGAIVSNMKFIKDDTCCSNGMPTVGTDGYDFYYHPDMVDKVNSNLYYVAHEVSHIALDHINRRKDKDQECWNISADAVINSNLKAEGIEIPFGSVDMDDAIDYDVESYYDKLLKYKKNNPDNKLSNEPENHKKWGSAPHKDSSDSKEENRKKVIEEAVKEISQRKDNDAFKENKKQKIQQLKKMRETLINQASNETASQLLSFDNIGTSKPLLNWRSLLRQEAKVLIDWSYQDATLEDGVLSPHLIKLPQSETEILLDTSGSVNEILLRNFLRECKNILQNSNIKVGCFDTKFYGFTRIRTEKDIDNLEIRGRGGTDFNVAVNSFSKQATNKIIFTDGLATMPNNSVNAIWVVIGNQKINPKGGKVINITGDALNELCTCNYIEQDYLIRRSK